MSFALLSFHRASPADKANCAETRDRTGDLQIFGLTLSQLSYRGRAIDMGVKMINASFLGRLVG